MLAVSSNQRPRCWIDPGFSTPICAVWSPGTVRTRHARDVGKLVLRLPVYVTASQSPILIQGSCVVREVILLFSSPMVQGSRC